MSNWNLPDRPAGRFEALALRADGAVGHLGPRELLDDAIADADGEGSSGDVQVVALRPRRVVASHEAGGQSIRY